VPNPVSDLLKADRWSIAEILNNSDIAIGMIRYRTPVLSGREAQGYHKVLKVVWRYEPEDSGELPSTEQSTRMGVFEDRFCGAVEHDALAALVAVLTFDGARQWVFYTGDVRECGARLNAMPQEAEPYPLKLTSEADPEWRYLRDEILKQVPWQE
jgi:hypothetical protein